MRRIKVLARGDQALALAILVILLLLMAAMVSMTNSAPDLSPAAYLPYFSRPPKPPSPTGEVRGLWVTRFDWTNYGQPAQKSRIDQIVNDAALANFNVIFFQVRGVADAYYQPGPEPWAQRVSGQSLGTPPNPWWDPLAYFVDKAHQAGIQLHAYINVYPVWDRCGESPPHTTPEHFYWRLAAEEGVTGSKLNGLQWDRGGNVSCSIYQRATPASLFADEQYLAVARHLADNYDIDGLHLDNIRYGGGNTSCDPISASRSGVPCFQKPANYPSYQAWQRVQVNGTVEKFYQLISQEHPELMLSAAVWPTYIDRWGFGFSQGYVDYYQDSQAWMKGGYIDAITPMIYGTSLYTQYVWETLVRDFQANSGDRFVVAGIDGDYDSFAEIEARIAAAREIGIAGQAIYAYRGLKGELQSGRADFFPLLAAGPYAEPATVPAMPWR